MEMTQQQQNKEIASQKDENSAEQNESKPELSPIEREARQQGWVPKDEWIAQGHSEDEWRSAREFVERGELYKSIQQAKAELRQLRMAHSALQKHHQNVFEHAYKKALDELKAERRAAMREQDFDTAEEISEKIDNLKAQYMLEKQQLASAEKLVADTPPSVHPDFVAWKSRNSWYDSDTELRNFADAIGMVYYAQNPNIPPSKVLEYVEQQVRERFPEKVGTRKAAPNAVLGVDKTTTKQSSSSAADDIELTDLEREVMRQLVAAGEMTEKQYKAELKKAKGVK